MYFMECLHERLADGRPFGFCPWEDGEGMLWGTLMELTETGFRIQEIGTLGELDAIEWYDHSQITMLDFGDRYSRRLELLQEFHPTKSASTHMETDRAVIEVVLAELLEAGAVAHVDLLGNGSSSTVRVLAVDDEWITMRDYDDLMQPYGLISHRLSNVLGIRIGTAYEEADEFVERAGL